MVSGSGRGLNSLPKEANNIFYSFAHCKSLRMLISKLIYYEYSKSCCARACSITSVVFVTFSY